MILGLEILHAITKYPQSYQLRVDLKDWDGNTIYAVYRYDCLILLLASKHFFKQLNLNPISKIACRKKFVSSNYFEIFIYFIEPARLTIENFKFSII